MANENHHWVPKLLLKKFADSDGRVFRLDLHTDRVSKPSPRKTCSSPAFYDFHIEGQTVSFEERFEKVETKAARALNEIVQTLSLARLRPKDRQGIADFVAVQSFRTEAFYKGLESSPSRGDFGQLLSQLWDSSSILSAQIECRRWALMVIESDEVFYLGDQPVVLQRTRNPRDGSNLGFDVEGIEAFMPLSPKCAIYMPSSSVSSEIIARYDAAMALHQTVRTAAGNAAGLMPARETIRRSHELYQSFTTGSRVRATTPHIENLNYLQCSWAHSGMYSNRPDFSFVRRVFRENPQYLSTPKTRLLSLLATRGGAGTSPPVEAA